MKTTWQTLLLFLCIGQAYSESLKPAAPNPVAPFVATPMKKTQWNIQVSYADDPKESRSKTEGPDSKATGPHGRLTKISVTKDAEGTRVIADYTGEKAQEGYLLGENFAIRSTTNSEAAVVMEAAKGKKGAMEVFTTDYQGSQWVDISYFRGVEIVNGTECYVYERAPDENNSTVTFSSSDAPPVAYLPLNHMLLRAFIATKTGIPIRAQFGTMTYDYSPVTAWDGKLTLPPAFQDAAQEFTRQYNILQKLKTKNQHP